MSYISYKRNEKGVTNRINVKKTNKKQVQISQFDTELCRIVILGKGSALNMEIIRQEMESLI